MNLVLQAIENVFAIGNKIPMGSCFCQPVGGTANNTAQRIEEFLTYDKDYCKVSRPWSTFSMYINLDSL